MRVELEKPSGASSRSRESAPAKGVVNCARPSQDVPIETFPVGAVASGIVPSRKWICVSRPVEKRTVSSQSDSRYVLNHPYYKYQNLLSTLCTPPQVVFDGERKQLDARSLIPPTPQALIFCCSNTIYGDRFGLHKLYVKKEY